MIKRTRKTILSCLFLLMSIFVLSAPVSAAAKDVKPVKKAVKGSKTYKIIDGELVCKKSGKKTVIKKVMSSKLYSNGKTIFFDGGFADPNIYALNLKTGKTKVLFKATKGIETEIVNSYKQYLYVRNQKWSYAINTSTGKARYMSCSGAGTVSIIPYKGYIYDVGYVSNKNDTLVLACYKANGKLVRTVQGNYAGLKLVDGSLYAIKFKTDSSKNTTQYRVYKTDKLLKKMKAVTKWSKTIPKKYR